jgi:uncharacterized protein YegJ (DUF2314 family)
MRRCLNWIAVFAIIFVGCGKKPAREDKVTMVADDDPRMTAAIEKARATVGTFTSALRSPKARQTAFSVKMAFTDPKGTEHMWLSQVSFDGQKFRGTVNNDPMIVSNVRNGQRAAVEPAKISDWMYVDNGKLVGGYTLRVLRDSMSAEERAEFDRSVPFTID